VTGSPSPAAGQSGLSGWEMTTAITTGLPAALRGGGVVEVAAFARWACLAFLAFLAGFTVLAG
jgi:hypothetical protein